MIENLNTLINIKLFNICSSKKAAQEIVFHKLRSLAQNGIIQCSLIRSNPDGIQVFIIDELLAAHSQCRSYDFKITTLISRI